LGIGTTGFESAQLERHGVNAALLVLASVIGARRRAQQLRERPLDDRLG
jgi:hypothetical protein